jgi:hypothetical protein
VAALTTNGDLRLTRSTSRPASWVAHRWQQPPDPMNADEPLS